MKDEIELRKVTPQDCELLFEWINEPVVRENAFNSDSIEWEEHKKWFQDQLENNKIQIYIGEVEGEPVGQVRFEKENSFAVISVTIASKFRGQGYGSKLINKGSRKILQKHDSLKELKARIKKFNKASIKAFQSAGYEFEREDTFKDCSAVVYSYSELN